MAVQGPSMSPVYVNEGKFLGVNYGVLVSREGETIIYCGNASMSFSSPDGDSDRIASGMVLAGLMVIVVVLLTRKRRRIRNTAKLNIPGVNLDARPISN